MPDAPEDAGAAALLAAGAGAAVVAAGAGVVAVAFPDEVAVDVLVVVFLVLFFLVPVVAAGAGVVAAA